MAIPGGLEPPTHSLEGCILLLILLEVVAYQEAEPENDPLLPKQMRYPDCATSRRSEVLRFPHDFL